MNRKLPAFVTSALICLLSASCTKVRVAALAKTIKAADGYDLITYELSRKGSGTPKTPRAIFFYIQGSEYSTVLDKTSMLASATIIGARIIVMEKRGCYPDSVDMNLAHKYADKGIRVSDNLTMLEFYLKDVAPDVPVVLIGGSEGGDVALAVAAKNKRISQLILIGSAGGWSQKTEFRYMVANSPGTFNCNTVSDLVDSMRLVETEADDMKIWLGHPYKRWRTYMNDSALNYIHDIHVPVLIVHCSEDKSVPVQSARLLADQFKAAKNIKVTYIEYKDLDHSFLNIHDKKSRYPYLELDMISWLKERGIVKSIEADIFRNRVKKAHKDIF